MITSIREGVSTKSTQRAASVLGPDRSSSLQMRQPLQEQIFDQFQYAYQNYDQDSIIPVRKAAINTYTDKMLKRY